jgi:predicted PurR-regulated permease PerM
MNSTSTPRPRNRLDDMSWRFIAKIVLTGGLLLLFINVVRSLTPLLLQLVIGIFLAIAADTVVRTLQRRGMSRGWAITAVILGGMLVLLAGIAIIAPPLVEQGSNLVRKAPTIARDIKNSDLWITIADRFDLSSKMIDAVQQVAVSIPELVTSFIKSVISGVFGGVTMLLMVVFLLTGGDRALGLLVRLVPRLSSADGWEVVVGTYTNIGRYVTGATLQALIAGVSLAAVLWIFGVPYALALGLFMLIMDYIPMVGATLGSIPAVLVALFTGGIGTGVAVLIFLVIYQQVENSIIQPRIQGKVVNLPGIAIFFSVLVGGQLLGVVGALFAVPIASIASIMIRQYLVYTGRDQITLPDVFDEHGNPRHGRKPDNTKTVAAVPETSALVD